MARLPQPGSDDGTWGDILNDFLSVEHNADGTLKSSGSLASKADDTAVLKKASNLSDVASSVTARTNLGLGTAATKDVASSGDALASQVVKGDDSRLSDARSPTAHHATHQPGGSDAIDYSTVILSGLLSGRPSAASANNGLLYFATDDNGGTLYRSTGTSWVQVAAAVNGISGTINSSLIDAKGDLLVGTADNTVARKATGTSGQTLLIDTTQSDNMKWVDLYIVGAFSQAGTLNTKTGASRFYVEDSCVIVGVRVSVGTAPTGASIIVDVNKNGSTVFTTQSNRPTIAVSSNTATASSPDVTSLAAGDYLSVDVDQVGSTVAGADLTVQIRLRRS